MSYDFLGRLVLMKESGAADHRDAAAIFAAVLETPAAVCYASN
jgi:hypothetical protein